MLNAKMCNVRTYVTHDYHMFSVVTYVTCDNIICLNLCYTWKYDVWCPNLHYIRKCVISEASRKYDASRPNLCFILNVLCLNICYTRIWDYFLSKLMLHTKMCNVRTYVTHEWGVFFPNLRYIRKYNMSEPMLHTKIWCLVSELILYMKMCNVRTHFTHENMMSFVRFLCYIQNK